MAKNTLANPIEYFTSLKSVRETTSLLLSHPDCLQNFNLDLSKIDKVIALVCDLIKRDYKSPQEIPPHSRWRHFEASTTGTKIDRITPLLNQWTSENVDKKEQIKRLLDLFVTSVLLDAGAGDKWKYKTENSVYNRSEGLAVASLDLFKSGKMSSTENKYQCDQKGLQSLTEQMVGNVFQVSEENPLVGLKGRTGLLNALGKICEENPKYFSNENQRPGNLLDFLLAHPTTVCKDGKYKVEIDCLWEVVIKGFSGVWPSTRTKLNGVSLGDVWPSEAVKKIYALENVSIGSEGLVCFHKLSQWITYSLMEPLQLYGIEFVGVQNLTGLAEYRNGGVFVDLGVLTLKKHVLENFSTDTIPQFEVFNDAIVEWRALTVGLLDLVAIGVRKQLGMTEDELPLAKVLEAGTWKAGREMAKKLRPATNGPPIIIISDGTVF